MKLLQLDELQPSPRPVNPDNQLTPLSVLHEPSKRGHDYIELYWRELRDIRNTTKKVLEIGVQTPRSVKMWRDFFPNAVIYGIDIDPRCAEFAEDRIEIFVGDQTDESFLLDVIKATGGQFDVVIDDGQHSSYSILKSFSYLYPALDERGIYVIEDIMKLPPVMQFLQLLNLSINHYPDDVPLEDWPALIRFDENTPWLAKHTVGLSIYRFIAFIRRGFNPGDNPNLMEPEELVVRRNAIRKPIEDYLSELEAQGVQPEWSQLIERFGPTAEHHIATVLNQRGYTVTTEKPQGAR